MGKILANEKLSDDFYLIEVEEKNQDVYKRQVQQ